MTDERKTASPVTEGELPEVLKNKRQLGPNDAFSFGCHKGVPCFTDCCGDINILLAPYDVLRLARHIGMSTGDFIKQHTLTPITKDLQLPVKMLRMGDDEKHKCPFVGDDGCTVYEARPWACRMYPLGMALPPARAGQEPEPIYFLFADGFCKGHAEAQGWTASDWRQDQDVLTQEAVEEGFREIVIHPFFIGGVRHLEPRQIEMFHMASYDLDTFRRFVFESSFLQRFEVPEPQLEKMRSDDDELLKFAFRWLRYALFGEPTMTVREGAPQVRRPS